MDGTVTLKGGSFEHELIVMTERVEASTPEELEEAVAERMKRAPES